MYFTNKQALAFLSILTVLTALLSSGAFAQTTNTWTGQTRRQSLHVCCHFDPKKRIDYYSLYFPAGSPDETAALAQ